MPPLSRRRYLQFGAAAVTVLAGCAESQPAPATDGEDSSTTTAETASTTVDAESATAETDLSTSATPTGPTSTAASDDLDLREANVVGVVVESENGSYRFDVTLIHDDDGEDGYADWWQVETLDGEQLGRRELLHAHGTQEFTRSETVEIPDGTTCVVVRGHDQIHGYGGQAMLVNLETGATKTVRQRAERQSFAASECP